MILCMYYMFRLSNEMRFYEVLFHCRANLSFTRSEIRVIDAKVNIQKSVFQTAEGGVNYSLSGMRTFSKIEEFKLLNRL